MLLTAALLAQIGPHSSPPGPYHPMASTSTTVTIPTKLTEGDQLYQGNISGFRRYLNDIKQTDRELFLLLDSELTQLDEEDCL